MNYLIRTLAALVVAAAASGAVWAENVKIRLGVLHTELIDTPVLHGIAKGYFKDRGIDLELFRFDNGTQVNQALAGGSIDAAVAGAATVQQFAVQGHGVIVAPAYLDDNSLYANPASGVKSVSDLAGKKVAFPLGTTANVLVIWALQDAGVPYTAIEPVNAGYGNTAAALISGAVPAAVVAGPHERLLTRERPDIVKISDLKRMLPNRVVFGAVVASNEFHKRSREQIVNLVAAYIRSYEEIWRDEPMRRKVYDQAYAKNESYDDFKSNLASQQKPPTPEEWLKFIDDGSVAKWAVDVAKALQSVGTLKTIADPKQFLDGAIYVEAFRRNKLGTAK